ncbi:MAG TPA: hypothetical protein VMI12_19350 [Puia sp.]|nr:hypothetical protein [Puia sp.]
MNFLKAKTSWKNIEFIPFKLCIASAYLVIGSFFHSFIQEHLAIFIELFILTVIWTLYLWIKKMRQQNNQ